MYEDKYGEVDIHERFTIIRAVSIFEEVLKNAVKSERRKVIAEVREWAYENAQFNSDEEPALLATQDLHDKLDSMVNCADSQPAIRQERTAKIIMRHREVGETLPECSNCDVKMLYKSNYCPNCGAKFVE